MSRREPREYSTYTKIVRVTASKLGLPPSNPPAVDVYGITHVLEFTVGIDHAYYKSDVPTDYHGGDINIHVHWTKSTTNSDQSGKKVKWQFKYLILNGTSENCNSGESTLTVEDTYESAVQASQIIYQSDNITIPISSIDIHHMIIIEISAIDPDGETDLSDDPALVYFDIEYTAKHIP